jgi:hypothetical protein
MWILNAFWLVIYVQYDVREQGAVWDSQTFGLLKIKSTGLSQISSQQNQPVLQSQAQMEDMTWI